MRRLPLAPALLVSLFAVGLLFTGCSRFGSAAEPMDAGADVAAAPVDTAASSDAPGAHGCGSVFGHDLLLGP